MPLGLDASGRNAAVDHYFLDLQATSKRYAEEVEKMPAVSHAPATTRKKQLESNAQNRADAGRKMMQFIATLTPEQQKQMMSFDDEQQAMAYLKKIGKWDELMSVMGGVAADVPEKGLTAEEDDLLQRDLNEEFMAVTERMTAAQTSRDSMLALIQAEWEPVEERVNALTGKLIDAEEGEASGKGSGNSDALRAEIRQLLSDYYQSVIPRWLEIHQRQLDAVRARVEVGRLFDRKADLMNNIAGQPPLPPVAQQSFIFALEYLRTALDILLGDEYYAPEE